MVCFYCFPCRNHVDLKWLYLFSDGTVYYLGKYDKIRRYQIKYCEELEIMKIVIVQLQL